MENLDLILEKTDRILTENFEHTVELRRRLHMHPETEFEEFETAAIVAEELKNIGAEYESGIAKTGIKAVVRSAKNTDASKKCVLIRADMDALAVEEKNNVPYKSKNPGKMHACGHDAHVAVALSVLRALYAIRDELPGDVVFVFQPAEEGVGGAKPMIDENVLKNPEVHMALGLHVEPTYETGSVALKSGGAMASPDEFDIRVVGRGGHGAYRQKCADPIYAAAKLIGELIDFGKDCSSAESECVISIGEVSGGNFYNVIPDEVQIKGTARAVDFEKRKQLADGVCDIAKKIGENCGVSCEVDYRFMYPPLVNDKRMTKIVESAAKSMNIDIVRQEKPFMGGDDFAYFAQAVPSAYCFLGCGNAEKDCVYPWHSNRFNIDEDCLLYGGRLLANAAVRALSETEF